MKRLIVALLLAAIGASYAASPVDLLTQVIARKNAGGGAPSDSPGTSNLVAWYSFDTDGTDDHSTLDLTGSGSPTHAAGKVGNAVDFESSSSQYYFHADDAAFDITGAMSVCAWVNFESDAAMLILDKYRTTGNQRSYRMERLLADQFKSIYTLDGGTGNLNQTTGSTATTTATWYFVVWTFEPSTSVKIYVNASQDANNTTAINASIYSGTAEVRVGSSNAGGDYFDGLMDELAIFNDLLTPDEITWLYNSGNGRAVGDL